MLGYSRLSNVLGKRVSAKVDVHCICVTRRMLQALFYVTILPFFAFYALFAFVLFPMRDVLHWNSLATHGRMSFILNLAKYWTFSVYYIVSELWGSVSDYVSRVFPAHRCFAVKIRLASLSSFGSALMMSPPFIRQSGSIRSCHSWAIWAPSRLAKQ
jgi:Fe2+ transport system protein B